MPIPSHWLPGAFPRPRDPRDYVAQLDIRPVMLPAQDLHLLPYRAPTLAQTGGSCVGFSAAHVTNMMWRLAGVVPPNLSGLYVYARARGQANIARDVGTTVQAGLTVVTHWGDCPATDWPLEMGTGTWVTPAADVAALPWKGVEYLRVNPEPLNPYYVNGIKAAINAGSPVHFGMYLYHSFTNLSPLDDVGSLIPKPGPFSVTGGDQFWGGHALVGLAYRDDYQAFLVQSSWGAGFGVGGFAWMPYSMCENMFDVWVLRVSGVPPVPIPPAPLPSPSALSQVQSKIAEIQRYLNTWTADMNLTQAIIDKGKGLATDLSNLMNGLVPDPVPTPVPDPTPNPTPTPSPTGTNVALASNGGVASSAISSGPGYPASAIINGDRKGANWGAGGGWQNAVVWQYGDGVTIAFAGAQTINRVVVYSMQNDYRNPIEPTDTLTFLYNGLVDFRVEAWNGTAWVVLASVTANNLVKRVVAFASTSTDKIRIVPTRTPNGWACLIEVEAWTA